MKKMVITLWCIAAVALQADFIRIDDREVVLDKAAGRMWQDNKTVTELKMNWEDAQAHCDKMVFNGFDDWRLPTKRELLSIVDKERKATKIAEAFRNTNDYVYWSSSKPKGDLPLSWRVDFDDGKAHWGGRRFAFFARCVRDMKEGQ